MAIVHSLTAKLSLLSCGFIFNQIEKDIVRSLGNSLFAKAKKHSCPFAQKLVNKNSSIKIGNENTFGGDTAIGENARIEKHIHDSSINYSGNKMDITSIESISKYITNNHNERKVSLWSGLLAIIGLIGDLISINSILPEGTKVINFIPKFNQTFGWVVFSICFLFLIGGIYILSAVQYKYNSTCQKCKKHYAIKEKDNPQIREVKAHDGIKRTVTRHYYCENCGFEKSVPSTETIPYENY